MMGDQSEVRGGRARGLLEELDATRPEGLRVKFPARRKRQ